jgi:hypothetical protein
MRAPLAALSLLALAACSDWRERVDPARAAEEPAQAAVQEPAIVLSRREHLVSLTPRATYRITGYAVDTSRELLDDWDFVAPMDVALAWGPVADPAVLRKLEFHLSRRYVSYRWREDPGVGAGVLASHIANHHLIPADDTVAEALDEVKRGDLVTLVGRLVDVEIRDGTGRIAAKMKTSLRRDDVGSGACENVYVEEVAVER